MSWENTWNGKRKDKPNQLRSKPTIAFRSNLSPEALGYIKKLAGVRAKSNFIRDIFI